MESKCENNYSGECLLDKLKNEINQLKQFAKDSLILNEKKTELLKRNLLCYQK